MRLITWNVGRRVGHVGEIARALLRRSPDVIALQEVTAPFAEKLHNQLAPCGLDHQFSTGRRGVSPKRAIGVMVASRWPLELVPCWNGTIPWPEKALSVVVRRPSRPFELTTVHIPNGSANEWTKIETLEGVFNALATRSRRSRILCGDFNTPRDELPNGQVVTWAQRIRTDGTARIVVPRNASWDAARWDAGERNVLEGLAKHDLADVYELTGNPNRDGTYFARSGKARRFDHVFASKSAHAVRCKHLQRWRLDGLSDHAAVEVEFA